MLKGLYLFLGAMISVTTAFASAQTVQSESHFAQYEQAVLTFVESSGDSQAVKALAAITQVQTAETLAVKLEALSPANSDYSTLRSEFFDSIMKQYSTDRSAQFASLAKSHSSSELKLAVENTVKLIKGIEFLSQGKDAQWATKLHYAKIAAKYALIAFDSLVGLACLTPAVIGIFYWGWVVAAVNIVLAIPIVGDYAYEHMQANEMQFRNTLSLAKNRQAAQQSVDDVETTQIQFSMP